MINWGEQRDGQRRSVAPRGRSNFRMLVLAVALAAQLANADDRYWVGGSGDWGDFQNWSSAAGGQPGAFPPGADDAAYIRTNDAVNRSINLALGVGSSLTVQTLTADSLGSGSLTLQLASGAFGAQIVSLGSSGSARFIQTGGAVDIGYLGLSRSGIDESAASTSSYQLSAGSLTTKQTQLGLDDGVGSFQQTGGTHTTGDLYIENGQYELSGGLLRATSIGAIVGFHQTGGAVDADEIMFSYRWDGGTLLVRKQLAPRNMSFPSVPASLTSDRLIDFGEATLSNTQHTILTLGEHALFIHEAGFDPTTAFAGYANAGLDHVVGTPLVIPEAKTIYGTGYFTDPIECRGTLLDPTPDEDDFYVQGVFHVYPGGSLSASSLIPRGHAEISGGTVIAKRLSLGLDMLYDVYGSVSQTAGTVRIDYLSTGNEYALLAPRGGSYELAGGSLFLISAGIGTGNDFFGPPNGQFLQSGGSNVVDDLLAIGSGESATGVYEISGGMLRARTVVVSHGARLLNDQPPKYGTGTLRITGAAADIHVGSELRFGPYSSLEAVSGATIHFDSGAVFTNNSTDPAALAGLANIRLVFDGAATAHVPGPMAADAVVPSTFEVAGADRGAVEAGFSANFVLGVLEIGRDGLASLQLIDDYDNRTGASLPHTAEAIYIDQLILGNGSTLDLNGLNVYAHQFIDNGGTLILGGGELTVVPEPMGIATLALAAAGSALRRRRGKREAHFRPSIRSSESDV